jgi:hypothetical protein
MLYPLSYGGARGRLAPEWVALVAARSIAAVQLRSGGSSARCAEE